MFTYIDVITLFCLYYIYIKIISEIDITIKQANQQLTLAFWFFKIQLSKCLDNQYA